MAMRSGDWKLEPVTGVVTRKFAREKFAELSIRLDGQERGFYGVKFFDPGLITTLSMVNEGDRVTVGAHIERRTAQNKAQKTVQVDGYDLWVNNVVGDSLLPAEKQPSPEDF